MKQFTSFILILLLPFLLFAQFDEAEYEKEITRIKNQALQDALVLKKQLESQSFFNEAEKNAIISFKADTFRIEQTLIRRLDFDFSTMGMVQAFSDAEAEYDKLLNTWYQALMKVLSSEDKTALRQSQRNWIQFRDSERLLFQILAKDEYSGGGSIQRLIVASQYMELTKKRVLELFNYYVALLQTSDL